MIPLKLTLSGFMSYYEAQSLDFQGDTLWVLVGKNASGKSSVFDAIVFALFNTSRTGKQHHENLVNHNSNIAVITFDFAVGSKSYRVRRTVNTKGQMTFQASFLLPQPDGTSAPDPIPGTHTKDGFENWVESDLGLNYETFVTSVLLQQGKAEVFLNADTTKRYEVLSKLIDLSKYIALEAKAKEQKRDWESQAAVYQRALDRLSPVTEQDLVNAQTRIIREGSAVAAARQRAGDLQILFGQANRWEQLQKDLSSTVSKIEAHQTLLNRSAEIENGYRRLVDLRTVLPSLKAIFDLAQAIRHSELEIEKLTSENRVDYGIITTSEAAVASLTQDRDQKAQRHQEISAESMQILRRLRELTPVIGYVDQVDRRGKAVEAYRAELTHFPSDLDTLFKEKEARRDHLVEAERVLPGLKRLTAERSKLPNLIMRRDQNDAQLRANQQVRPSLVTSQAKAQTTKEQAESHEKSMRQAHTEASTLLREARKRMDNFELVANAAKCQFCGNDLSDEHKAEERIRLEKDRKEKIQLEEIAKDNLSDADRKLEGANADLQKANAALATFDGEIREVTNELQACTRDIQSQLSALEFSYDGLPSSYRVQVAPEKPVDLDGWMKTTYPQASELANLDTTVKSLPGLHKEVSGLSARVTERTQAQIRLGEAIKSLVEAKALLPDNWEALQSEHETLSASSEKINTSLQIALEAKNAAVSEYDKAKASLDEIRNRQSRRLGTLSSMQTSLGRDRESLESQVSQLQDGWYSEARGLTNGRLSELTAERKKLEQYEAQHQLLGAAEQGLKDLLTHKGDVESQIESIPVEARRSADKVEVDLTLANDEHRQAEARLGTANTRRSQLETEKIQYQETESNLNAARRKSLLYGILSEQFGEKGIQKAIVNKAEVAIVHLSNQVLDSLSGGRSKLRLREVGGNKKALDLEVWDTQTGGGKPILTSFASGSQRFRIAISLALGIGQYIGRESNRIESVIIDEGFGSLDREGRESIIQELYALRQHLKRIILVSHQEEFARGFSTGYEIHLVDGTSQVKPLAG